MATSCIAKSMKPHTLTESRSISNRAIVSIAFDLPEQRADDLRRRALAATVGTEGPEELTLADAEVDARHGDGSAGVQP